MADKYGIPAGGDPYPGKIKYYKGNRQKMTWEEAIYAVEAGGWPEDKWVEAAALMGAESNLHPYIYNTFKKGHFGAFQVSRSAWPEFFAGDSEQWTNPGNSARKAYEIYKKQGWRAWEAYNKPAFFANKILATNGLRRYLLDKKGIQGNFLDKFGTIIQAAAGSDNAQEDIIENAPGVSGLNDIGKTLAGAWEAITTPAFWMRIAYGTTGVVLVVGGLFLIVRNTPAIKAAAQTAQKAASVTPVGRAATVAKGATA